MTGQILLRELVRKSAHEAFEAGKTIEDCPPEFILYHHEWCAEFRLAAFEYDCESDPCSL